MATIRKECKSEQEAQEFIDSINLHLGIPSSENATAQSYTDIVEENGKFYVDYDDSIIIFEL